MCVPNINFLDLTDAEKHPTQDYRSQIHHYKVKGQIKVTA